MRDEIGHLREDIALQEERLKVLLIPKDPNDNKNTILEIRSGTGGDEAALFAGNLYRMYLRFTERQNWKSEIMTLHDNEGGGIKEIIVTIIGEGAYGLVWKVSNNDNNYALKFCFTNELFKKYKN